ncbi:hypothetical protein H0H92_005606 [Tricholoma furcatifolium]|nr:hypothetical protein H0H92_005606 [Tricholoma furcatifolium]
MIIYALLVIYITFAVSANLAIKADTSTALVFLPTFAEAILIPVSTLECLPSDAASPAVEQEVKQPLIKDLDPPVATVHCRDSTSAADQPLNTTQPNATDNNSGAISQRTIATIIGALKRRQWVHQMFTSHRALPDTPPRTNRDIGTKAGAVGDRTRRDPIRHYE